MDGTQPTNLLNILRFAISPSRVAVLARKLFKRLESQGKYSASENLEWIRAHQRSRESLVMSAPDLWSEALEFGQAFRERAKAILATVPFDMGAGGDYELLYWLTRYLKPEVIVETGVSAGWSSEAFLAAIRRNGAGKLYSSDFPYFRVREPEKYIGILVSDRAGWELHMDGDEIALPRILAAVPSVGLFHYDSDKSYSGRQFAVDVVHPKLTGPMVMDDIADNSWFREFVEQRDFAIIGRAGITPPIR